MIFSYVNYESLSPCHRVVKTYFFNEICSVYGQNKMSLSSPFKEKEGKINM